MTFAKPGKWWFLLSGLWAFPVALFGAVGMSLSYTAPDLGDIVLWLVAIALPPAFALFLKTAWHMFRAG